MEYKRTVDGAGNVYQWYDADRAMVLDQVTGTPERFSECANSVGTIDEAISYVKRRIGWESRLVIVRLQCVVAADVEVNK